MDKDKKQIRLYIWELLGFLFVAGVFIYTSVSGLIVRYAVIRLGLVFVVGAWLIHYVYSFVVFSVQAWIDLIRKDYCREKALFREQYVFRASSSLDTVMYEKMRKGKEKNMGIGQALSFKIIVKTKGGRKILTSSSYFELQENHRYEFVYGRRSGAVIDVTALEEKAQ